MYRGISFMPFFGNILTVVEVGKLPTSTIIVLAEVIKNIEMLDSRLFHGNLYKIKTIITLRGNYSAPLVMRGRAGHVNNL